MYISCISFIKLHHLEVKAAAIILILCCIIVTFFFYTSGDFFLYETPIFGANVLLQNFSMIKKRNKEKWKYVVPGGHHQPQGEQSYAGFFYATSI